MKFERKIGVKGIKIEHNKKLFWVIIGLIILLGIIVCILSQNSRKERYYFLEDNECIGVYEYPDKITFSHYVKLEDCDGLIIKECEVDSDCVASSCCHPESCVSLDEAPDCATAICSAVCSGPLDCGAGSCKCINGGCEVVANENK